MREEGGSREETLSGSEQMTLCGSAESFQLSASSRRRRSALSPGVSSRPPACLTRAAHLLSAARNSPSIRTPASPSILLSDPANGSWCRRRAAPSVFGPLAQGLSLGVFSGATRLWRRLETSFGYRQADGQQKDGGGNERAARRRPAPLRHGAEGP
ncbi:hypothetical protein GN956_G20332 [Arapaima gigas]